MSFGAAYALEEHGADKHTDVMRAMWISAAEFRTDANLLSTSQFLYLNFTDDSWLEALITRRIPNEGHDAYAGGDITVELWFYVTFVGAGDIFYYFDVRLVKEGENYSAGQYLDLMDTIPIVPADVGKIKKKVITIPDVNVEAGDLIGLELFSDPTDPDWTFGGGWRFLGMLIRYRAVQ